MSMVNQSVDLKRFNQVFFEECAEHLAEMEQILMSLCDREPDDEQLNAIFRAAHSIKGGAGIFGFDDMTVVTHVMESLLDLLRNREIAFAPAMIDLFLQAGDVIGMQLAGHRDGAEVRQDAVERVRERLQEMMEEARPLPDAETGTVPFKQGDSPPQDAPAAAARSRYELCFTPDNDIFKRGVRLDGIIADLAELAEAGSFASRAELLEVPELEGFDAESCCTRWHFSLSSGVTREEILDVFMFVADEEQLHLRQVPLQETPSPCPSPGGRGDAEQREVVDGNRPEGAATPQTATGPAVTAKEAAADLSSRRGSDADSSIRVSVARVDQLVNQVGELLITQAMLVQGSAGLDPLVHESLQKSIAQLERNCRDLQQSVMSIRLVPIGIVFSRFPRMVRDIAAKLGKNVEFKTSGDATELDKGVIEKIVDPLSHLVRNALDHGLESSEVRTALGKNPTGTLQLKASQAGGRIVIEVIDDGAGLDRDRILAKAAERGLAASETMSDEEVWQLIFAPGFSTAETVTDISGRGVGMDVVLKNVQSIGGRVQIASQRGLGSQVTISLPLTLAILEGLSVAVGGEKFVIPLSAIIESLQPKPEQLESVNGKEVVQVRGEYLPILRLHRLFNQQHAVETPERGILVLVEVEGAKVAVLVDNLLDEQQVVVKSIETNFRKVEGSAGATILGDGKVALILDVNELLTMQKKL